MSEPESLQVEILTPSRSVFAGEVEWMSVPTTQGLMEVLPGHAQMVTVLDIGLAQLNFANGIHWSIAVHGGTMEVDPGRVLILASEAERPEDIDIDRAKRKLGAVKEELAGGDVTSTHRLIQDRLRAEARIGAFETRREDGGKAKSGRAR